MRFGAVPAEAAVLVLSFAALVAAGGVIGWTLRDAMFDPEEGED